MKRRDFLAAAAVPWLGGTVQSQGSEKTTPSPIRCGILGLGHGHAAAVARVLSNLPEYEVVGWCEPDPDQRDRYRDSDIFRKLPPVSEEELLGDPSVRMIAVESDVPRLLGFAEKVITSGKHLHLDKPAGTSLEQFERILDVAEKKHLVVQMGYMFRYNPGFDLIRRAVRENWLGPVFSIRASMCTDLSPEKRKRVAHYPGGIMLILGCHLIDMIVLLLGRPGRVTSYLRHDSPVDDGLADNTLAVLEYDRALATVESNAQEPKPFPARRFKIVGPKGSIILSPLEPPVIRVALKEPAGGYPAGVTEEALPDLERHDPDFRELAACIRGERKFPYSKKHDARVQETVLRACGVEV